MSQLERSLYIKNRQKTSFVFRRFFALNIMMGAMQAWHPSNQTVIYRTPLIVLPYKVLSPFFQLHGVSSPVCNASRTRKISSTLRPTGKS